MIDGTQSANPLGQAASALMPGEFEPQAPGRRAGWTRADPRRRMSDHIAYALLVYTALQIFATEGALKGSDFALLPFLALIALVLAIIPACKLFERRWGEMDDGEAHQPATLLRFRRDRVVLWVLALGLPFVLTGLFKGLALLLA